MPRTIPLEWRLPNPPPRLVGRDREASEITAAIGRGPLTVVHGPEAIGKTAVVLHALHHAFADRLERTLYVPNLARLTAALSTFGDAEGSLVERALEVAEAHALTVVFELVASDDRSLPDALATYARASRWIAITALPPSEVTLPHAVQLAPLGDESIATLAVQWQGGLTDEDRVLAAAASRGSPSRLRRLLAARSAGGPDLLAQLDPAARRSLELLSIVEVPIDPASLAIDDLVEAGLVTVSAQGAEIRPSVRAVVAARHPVIGAEELRRTAEALISSSEPRTVAEAILLAIRGSAHELAASLLELHGERVFAGGEGVRLANVLVAIDDPRLSRWRLRAAVELGDGDVLPFLLDDAVGSRPSADRILWAEALMRGNRTEAALALISDLPDPAARLLAGRGLTTRGDLVAARAELEHLRALPEVPLEVSLGAAALAARIEAMSGHATAARAGLVTLRTRLASAPAAIARDVLHMVAAAYHDLGDLAATEAELARLEKLSTSDPLGRFTARRVRLVRSIVHVERGELAAADDALGELDRVTAFASLHRPFIAMISAQLAYARGQLHEAAARIATVGEGGYLGAWAAALSARIAMLDPDAIVVRGAPRGAGLWPACARIHLARLELRRGGPGVVAPADLELAGDDGAVELWFAHRALSWERALIAGHATPALAIAQETAQRCAIAGFAGLEREAMAGALDAALVLDESRAIAKAAAGDVPSWLPERLELLAAGSMPRTMRRARYLLGDTRAIDAIDQAVLAAVRAPRATVIAGTTSPWTAGWGVDRRRKCAWRPDGVVVALADKPQLWRLLDAIAAAPDGISKEQLVVRAWDVDYHPLRHDKLLHNSIHKLRKLIEDTPTEPRRILTTDDGYRLGDDAPVRLVE